MKVRFNVYYGCDMCIFLVRMRLYLLTLDAIDILCLVYTIFFANKIVFFSP